MPTILICQMIQFQRPRLRSSLASSHHLVSVTTCHQTEKYPPRPKRRANRLTFSPVLIVTYWAITEHLALPLLAHQLPKDPILRIWAPPRTVMAMVAALALAIS